MEEKPPLKLFATLTRKFARLLVPPTLSVPKREDLMPSLEVPIVKRTVLATLALPLPTVEFWTEEHLPTNLLATSLVFASILSLAPLTTTATILLTPVEVKIVKHPTNVSAVPCLTPLQLAELSMVVKPLDKSTATKLLVNVLTLV
jgi:hypothetical protein